jgi:hypothetical protein
MLCFEQLVLKLVRRISALPSNIAWFEDCSILANLLLFAIAFVQGVLCQLRGWRGLALHGGEFFLGAAVIAVIALPLLCWVEKRVDGSHGSVDGVLTGSMRRRKL